MGTRRDLVGIHLLVILVCLTCFGVGAMASQSAGHLAALPTAGSQLETATASGTGAGGLSAQAAFADKAFPATAIAPEGELQSNLKEIKRRALENSRALHIEGVLPAAQGQPVTFQLPLIAPDITDSGFYCIQYFVDEDTTAGGILDWNCGSRTYDGHTGTDFFLWPFAWYKMDTGNVKIVAAADGIIVDKADGAFDRCCDGTCGEGNYVVLEHEDGTRTIYYHMKKGSVTTKAIGQAVLKGEVIGCVGSSGEAGGPHVHFEVWDSAGAVVDPFAGSCSSIGTLSRWDNAPSYYNPTILALVTHSSPALWPTCPGAETPNAIDLYHAGGDIIFAAYQRDQLPGDITSCTVSRPDGTTLWSWNWTAPATYQTTGGFQTGTWTLPSDAATGAWEYDAVLRGTTYKHPFYVEPGSDSTTSRIYMHSETAKVDYGVASKSCQNSQEELYQHVNRSGVADYERMTVYSADMTQIAQGATLSKVDAHLWAKKVGNTKGGNFKIYVNRGDANSSACSACMDWSQALSGCDIDGVTDSLVFSNSNTAIGRYTNLDMASLFTNKNVILRRAAEALANYSQYNHYLYFRCIMLAPTGVTNTYADGYMHGETAAAAYKPYVDVTYTPAEAYPPVPDPAQWAAKPFAPVASTTSLSMSAFEASDATPPVQYYFECTSGGPGAGSRDWNASRAYTDDGLSPNTQYSYRVKSRDSAISKNVGSSSTTLSAYTRALTPPKPTVANPTDQSAQVNPSYGSNPSYTELAIWNETSAYWVDASGGNGGTNPTWKTDAAWGTVTVTGLAPSTGYCFRVEARNGDGLVTDLGDTACVKTMEFASVDGDKGDALVFSVSRATPNPATGAIQVRFTLPEPQPVRIRVYDVAGRVVRELANAKIEAGHHESTWDGRNASGQKVEPGAYFLRFEAESRILTQKLVIVR